MAVRAGEPTDTWPIPPSRKRTCPGHRLQQLLVGIEIKQSRQPPAASGLSPAFGDDRSFQLVLLVNGIRKPWSQALDAGTLYICLPNVLPHPPFARATEKAPKIPATTPADVLTRWSFSRALRRHRQQRNASSRPDSHVYGAASKARAEGRGKNDRTVIRIPEVPSPALNR